MKDFDQWRSGLCDKFPHVDTVENLFLLRELYNNCVAYDDNFVLLEKSVGTAEHHQYVHKEDVLHKNGCRLRRKLGIFVQDNCPIKANKYCSQCTGNIRVVRRGKSCSYVEHTSVIKEGVKVLVCPVKESQATMCLLGLQ